jgi:hypothetical protein
MPRIIVTSDFEGVASFKNRLTSSTAGKLPADRRNVFAISGAMLCI